MTIKNKTLYLNNAPLLLQWLYPRLTWHRDRSIKQVFLTFDDGPVPVVTPFVLNTLKSFEVQATFFCIGNNVRQYPDIYQNILADGHQTGNHTFDHLRGWDTSTSQYINNFIQCRELVPSPLFRPPYGRIKRSQIRQIKHLFPSTEIIMWDVLSGDFDTSLNADDCVKNVLKHVRNGSIIVFHDSVKAFPRLESALPEVIQILKSQGYGFGLL